MAAIFVMAAIGGWAVLSGHLSYVLTSGISMKPHYHQNDLVFVIKSHHYHRGQIAAYHGSAGREVLHRIVAGDARNGYVFKGDNNRSVDTITPTADEVIGRAVLHVPKGGVWLKPLLSPTGLGMMGFLVVSSGAAVARSRREIPRGRRKKKVKAMARQGGSWATALASIKAVQRLPPLLQAVSAMVGMAAALAVALGVLGWMRPTIVARKATAEPQRISYSYSATVPRSPAYDSTTATSPDPIFRKLANHVDLQLRYRGRPGTLSVTATLTNGSGWHTTISLVQSGAVEGTADPTTVPLDLDALENRADAAAKAIGIDPAPVSIALAAKVTTAGLAPFTAPLQLNLTPLQLALASGKASLTVSSADGGTTMVPRTIDVLGWQVMTAAAARSWAVLLLIIAGAGAAVVALAARQRTPLRTRAEIERRFPQLLVHVEQMASPPGKPVVNVDNFPALAKLAERYGQMILTWRRPDADDFVVRDEGITYRYRVPLEEAELHNVERIDRPTGAGSHRRRSTTEVS